MARRLVSVDMQFRAVVTVGYLGFIDLVGGVSDLGRVARASGAKTHNILGNLVLFLLAASRDLACP